MKRLLFVTCMLLFSTLLFPLNGNKDFHADYAADTFTLTIVSDNGVVNKNPNQTSYNSGTSVELTAVPSAGYTFTGWSGDATGSTNPLTVTMDGNKTITANYSLNSYTLTIISLNGTVVSDPGHASYNHGTPVQLTAIPAVGYTFTGWSGDATGSANPITITMDGNKNITANYAITSYTLTIVSNNGTVSKNPGQVSYNHGSTVELTATPSPGYTFTGWSGDATGSVNPLTVTMDGNKNITANYEINTYTLTIISNNGVVSKNPSQIIYNHGTPVQLTVTPAYGYTFIGWSGDASGSTNPLTLTMDGNKTITANYAINTYTITITSSNGTVSKNPNQANFDQGTHVQLTATPAAGYTFTGWSGDATGSVNPLTVTMDGNKNITANYEINTYTLTIISNNGVVIKNPSQIIYNHGTLVQLTVTPAFGYTFSDWSGDASGSANPLTVTMDGNKTINANYSINTYTLAITSVNGTVIKNPNHASYDHGTQVQLTATPAAGYTFTGWSGDATGSSNPLTVMMDGNKNITAIYASNTYTLTIISNNGVVSKNPVQASYNHGTQVQLTVTPEPGYTFSNWSGDAAGSTNPLTITMDGNKTITANYSINTYTITITSSNGTVSKNPNQTSYDHGTQVQLTATPAAGYTFSGWSGDATGSINPLTITIDGNKNITANFTLNTYTLTVNSINGTVSKNPVQVSYNHGTQVHLTATPAPGYTFTGWSGDAAGSTNPLTITMDGNKTITANYSINTYTITITSSNGTISKNPNQASYNHGTQVQLTAVPEAGYTFTGWSGDVTGSTNPLTIIVEGNKNITANFTLNTYTLTINSINGTVSKNPVQASYNHGTQIQLTATPAPGYTFTGWSGDAAGSTNPLTITMDGNKTITADYSINTYTITITSANGTVSKNPNQASYNFGTQVQLTAVPAAGYTFTGWSGDITGSTNPLTITVDGNKSITAIYTINTYTLTIIANNGTVSKNPGQAYYNHGTTVELTATASPGYSFTGWSGDISGSTNPLIVTMDGNKTITANFSINTYTLTVNSPNGTVSKTPNQASYNHGVQIQLTVTPAAGYTFTGWSGDASGSTNPLIVTMNSNKTITANYSINIYTLTITSVNGTVSKNPDQESYNHGTQVQLTATPAVGYTFTGWGGDGSGSANPLTLTMNGNKTITANYSMNTYTLTITSVNGTVSKNPDQESYNHGIQVQLTATPAAGYTFTGWTGDVVGSTNPLTITMNGNKTITANYSVNTYSLTIISVNGTVTKSPNQVSYNHGTQIQLTATPAAGYIFANWSGDATGSTNPLTVTMNGNKTITANYNIEQYSVTTGSNPSNGGTTKGNGNYNFGSNVTVTATPSLNWAFVNWTESGIEISTSTEYTFVINKNRTLVANFITVPNPPTAIASTLITQTSFKANWNASNNAIGYYLDVAIDENFNNILSSFNNKNVGNVLNCLVTDLTPASKFYYRVRANNAVGFSNSSNVISVSTLPYSPSAPVAIAATDIKLTSFTARWNSSTSATGYYLDVAIDANFTNKLINYDNKDVSNVTSFVVSGLVSNFTYYYRVRAYNGGGISVNSNSISVLLTDIFEVKLDLPTSFQLFQNYPNPFNPSTKIKIGIPKECFVSLVVYDVIGSEIKKLINQFLPAATYTVNFDARNLNNGIYFYKLQAGEYTETKKMIFMK